MVDAENYTVTGFPFPFSSTISWKEVFLPRGGDGEAFFLHWCLCSSIPFNHIISLKFCGLLSSKVPTSSAPSQSVGGLAEISQSLPIASERGHEVVFH